MKFLNRILAEVQPAAHHVTTIPSQPFTEAAQAVISAADISAAYDEISQWSGYQPTPLRSLSKLAETLGIAEIFYKDEAARFGLGSFKALGGAYAVLRFVAAEYLRQTGQQASLASIRNGEHAEFAAKLTVSTATDGNHGRSVAWGAQQAGCYCRIYIHAQVSPGRQSAMEAYGAEVIRIAGDYDESVRLCARESDENGWQVVSDTSYKGYVEIPRLVMMGYTVLASELSQQNAKGFSHVFLQAGVGGLAAATSAALWLQSGVDRPRIIIVESSYSACVMESFRKNKPANVPITAETVMAGLSCGEMSPLAYSVLSGCVDDLLTLTDDQVALAMAMMADGEASTQPIEAGECAVPGVLAVMACHQGASSLREQLRIDEHSRVLVLGCEGATDRDVYDELLTQARSSF